MCNFYIFIICFCYQFCFYCVVITPSSFTFLAIAIPARIEHIWTCRLHRIYKKNRFLEESPEWPETSRLPCHQTWVNTHYMTTLPLVSLAICLWSDYQRGPWSTLSVAWLSTRPLVYSVSGLTIYLAFGQPCLRPDYLPGRWCILSLPDHLPGRWCILSLPDHLPGRWCILSLPDYLPLWSTLSLDLPYTMSQVISHQ